MKQTLIATAVVILASFVLVGVVVVGSQSKSKKTAADNQNNSSFSASDITYYYGNTCPHCKEVADWISENKIDEKLKIVKKEVYDNISNAAELKLAAQKCGLDTNSIGVPFLYSPEGKCFIGTPDVIAFLKDKAGL